ncbi:hypothetical protein Q4E93_18850 [Flavitalea sp. BT771]|uniref:hypothetical protein n=1 Tax=Flavitalea sp. BT771 TaxID=3063329 RepID=UPI0026E12258|nr:hypothetical protein [Flavitalea sp. BT771]MDO6432672.1 hypothetical protein [Flavitalea sp. BT771]MDV6222052.1 hypothetical protein [Flavitalea sp. BT771]
MMFNVEVKDTGAILSDLLTTIRDFQGGENVFVSRLQGDDRSGPATAGVSLSSLGIKEAQLPEPLNILGIRSLTLSAPHDLEALSRLSLTLPAGQSEERALAFFNNEAVIEALRSLFRDCHTVAFDDWASLHGASALWDGLRTKVIKPLGKNDLEFIFYLGDSARKHTFEVDEAIDIINDFSKHGKVTLALDENEAVKLWMVLNGMDNDAPITKQSLADRKKNYFSMFRTLNVAHLLIWSENDVIFFSNEQQFMLSRQQGDLSIETAPDARQNFIAGYSLGLLMQLDVAHCILLGLAVFASIGESKKYPEQKDLSRYIQQWIEDLQNTESIHLYQD